MAGKQNTPEPGKGPIQRSLSLMFTDLVDSTRLYQERGDAYARLLVQRYNDVLLPKLEHYGGTLHKTIGDTLMAIFPNAKKALGCAMAMQQALDDYNRQAPPADRLHVRIGIHHGKAIVEGGDVYGDAVNTAARIEAEAGGGEIYTSQSTWNMAATLDTEVERLGEYELKGLQGKISLLKIHWNAKEIKRARQKYLESELMPSLAVSLAKKKCTLILGGLTMGQRAGTVKNNISKKLAVELGLSERRSNLAHLATLYEEENDRDDLLAYVGRHMQAECSVIPELFHALAAAPFDLIVTTEIDDRMERALIEAGRQVRKVAQITEASLTKTAKNQVILIKLFGDLEASESVAITEENVGERLDELRLAPDDLLGRLATGHVLFIGFRWNSPEFKRLYATLTTQANLAQAKAIGLSPKVAAGVRGTWRRKGLILAQTDELSFAKKITQVVEEKKRQLSLERERKTKRLVRTSGGNRWKRPYKFLSFFTEEDAEIFFGRQEETRKIFSQVVSHRLVVLHAPSGSGKTSLLNAGVIPALRLEGFAVVTRRAFKDPEQEIREGVAALMQEEAGKEVTAEWMAGALSADLNHFLAEACGIVGKPMVVILDQFEEFFLRLPKKIRKSFIDQMNGIKKDRSLNVSFVLSMRHDFLHHLSEFRSRIPDIFHHDYDLHNLSQEGMEKAITAPARLAGLTFEEGLVARILKDLGTVGAEPPQLQIICDRLYDELAEGEKEFSLSHYEGLGSAKGILGSYLERFLESRTPTERELGRDVLKALVSSMNTKSVVTTAVVAQEAGKSDKAVENMLNFLLQARLVRKLVGDEGESFELSHEYLIEEISSWIEEKDRDRKRVRELLKQEQMNFERFGLLMAPSRVALIHRHVPALKLNRQESELIRRSIRSHRKKTRQWIAGMVFFLLTVLAATFAITWHMRGSLCQGAQANWASVWSPLVQAKVQKAFAATKMPYAQDTFASVDQVLSKFGKDWTNMHTDACEATHVKGGQSEELLDLRMICLEHRRQELRALLEIFGHADQKVLRRAVQAIHNLAPISRCSDIEALSARVKPPKDAAIRKKVEAVRGQLGRIGALFETAKYQDGLALSASVVETAGQTGYPPVLAEAYYWQGVFYAFVGQSQEAQKTLLAALHRAIETGHDELEAKTAIALTFVVGYLQHKHEAGLRWAKHAEAVIARFGNDKILLSDLRYKEASVYFDQGQIERALRQFELAVTLSTKAQGAEHPRTATYLVGLGIALFRSGQDPKARQTLERALAIKEKTAGSSHPDVANCLDNLAIGLIDSGQFDEAQQALDRALTIYQNTVGAQHPWVATNLLNQGELARHRGKLQAARDLFQRALSLSQKSFGPAHPENAHYLLNLAKVDEAQERWQEARQHLEQAQSICTQQKCGPEILPAVHFQLARVMWAHGHDRSQARDVAHLAQEAYAGMKNTEKNKTEIETWLKKHVLK